MKKNLLSVLILALLIVNIVLNVIMMISVIGTNSKTAQLVTSVATVLNLELYGPGGEAAYSIPLSQTATYALGDRIMVQLKNSVDENGNPSESKTILFYMSLAMDKENDDYAKYGSAETLATFEIQIKDAVESVVREYTEQECRDGINGEIKEEILAALRRLFQSDFIYSVAISDVMYQ